MRITLPNLKHSFICPVPVPVPDFLVFHTPKIIVLGAFTVHVRSQMQSKPVADPGLELRGAPGPLP